MCCQELQLKTAYFLIQRSVLGSRLSASVHLTFTDTHLANMHSDSTKINMSVFSSMKRYSEHGCILLYVWERVWWQLVDLFHSTVSFRCVTPTLVRTGATSLTYQCDLRQGWWQDYRSCFLTDPHNIPHIDFPKIVSIPNVWNKYVLIIIIHITLLVWK